jgi:hypothetical protein
MVESRPQPKIIAKAKRVAKVKVQPLLSPSPRCATRRMMQPGRTPMHVRISVAALPSEVVKQLRTTRAAASLLQSPPLEELSIKQGHDGRCKTIEISNEAMATEKDADNEVADAPIHCDGPGFSNDQQHDSFAAIDVDDDDLADFTFESDCIETV